MMKADLYNIEGEKKGKVEVSSDIFGIKMNSDLVYQVVRVQQMLRRQNTAHTKQRGEVRGGGKKPWRQKGTGRARHGSIRSPLWRGGGVTFGPRNERNYKKKLNKKSRRKALFMVLSAKLESNMIFFVSDLNFKEPKTKLVHEFIDKTFCKGSTLIVLPNVDKNAILAARNLEGVSTIQAKDINPLDLMSYKYLIIPKESVNIIKENFASDKLVEAKA